MNEDKRVQKEILIFLSDRIRRNERRKDISQVRKTWKFLALCSAMDRIEEWGKVYDVHKNGQGGALCQV